MTPEQIEAAVQIDAASCPNPEFDIADSRRYFNNNPSRAVPFLTAASKHTGADELAAALEKIGNHWLDPVSIARTALAEKDTPR
jgi:hypothetical protein